MLPPGPPRPPPAPPFSRAASIVAIISGKRRIWASAEM
jgi:hypothetical protein